MIYKMTLSDKNGWVNSYEIYDENDNNIHSSHKQEIFEVEDVKKAIQDLKEDDAKGIRMVIKMYTHKSGEELASEIIDYLNNKVKLRIFGEELIKPKNSRNKWGRGYARKKHSEGYKKGKEAIKRLRSRN